jgi:gas vesicle protein
MHEHTMNGEDMIGRGTSGLTGFVLGAVIGASIALLLAPATGTDTRRKLGEVARNMRDKANDRFGNVREGIENLKQDAKSAIEGGREAYRQSRQSTSAGTGSYTNPAA